MTKNINPQDDISVEIMRIGNEVIKLLLLLIIGLIFA